MRVSGLPGCPKLGFAVRKWCWLQSALAEVGVPWERRLKRIANLHGAFSVDVRVIQELLDNCGNRLLEWVDGVWCCLAGPPSLALSFAHTIS
jgi:hypothetical protein